MGREEALAAPLSETPRMALINQREDSACDVPQRCQDWRATAQVRRGWSAVVVRWE